MEPIWKPAVCQKYADMIADLEVSNTGVIRQIVSKKIYSIQIKDNQVYIQRQKKRLFVRFIVAETFIGAGDDKDILEFKDGDRNNLCASNLQYVRKCISENIVINSVETNRVDNANELNRRLAAIETTLKLILELVSSKHTGENKSSCDLCCNDGKGMYAGDDYYISCPGCSQGGT